MGGVVAAFAVSVVTGIVSSLLAPAVEQKAPEPNLRMPRSKFNDPIPLIYGRVRLGSNKFYPDTVDKMYFVETKKKSSGGKGGPRVTTEEKLTYATFAALFCQNQTTIEKLFMNGKEIEVGGEFWNKYVTFFDGTQTVPWSEMQVNAGPNFNQIAYKHLTYIGLTDLALSNDLFGGALPQQIDAVLVDARFGANPGLDVVVQDLCNRAGLDNSQIDVSDLVGITLNEGLAVNESGDGYRKVLEDLMQFYLFTGFEDSNGIIVFRKLDRGAIAPIVLQESDFIPVSESGVDNQSYIKTTEPQQNLPNKITISFLDIEQHWEDNEVVEYFEDFTKENNISLDSRLSTHSDFIRQQARLILNYLYITERNTYKFKLPISILETHPTFELLNVVQLPNGDLVQLHKINPTNDYMLDCEGKLYYEQINYNYSALTPTISTGNVIGDSVIPDIYVVDSKRIPDYTPSSFYGFATAPCVIEFSYDSDFSDSEQVRHAAPSVIGTTLTVLPDGGVEDPPIYNDTLDIQLDLGEVFSASNKNDPYFIQSKRNLALVGSLSNGVYDGVFIQYGTITDLGSDQYRLSEIRWGLHGTYTRGERPIGDRIFVFRDQENLAYYSTLRFVGIDAYRVSGQPNKQIYYRALVSNWQDLGSTAVTAIQPAGNAYSPNAPTSLASQQDAQDNIKISWNYNSSYSAYNANDTDTDVTYEIDIIQSSTVQNTLTSETTEVIYGASQRTTDGVTFPFQVQVFAVSDLFGRGDGSTILTINEDLSPPDVGFVPEGQSNVRGIIYVNGTTNPATPITRIIDETEDRYEFVVQNATVDEYTYLDFPATLPIGFEAFVTNQKDNHVGARIKIQVPSVASRIDYVDMVIGSTAIVLHLGGGLYKITGNNQLNYAVNGTTNNDVIRQLNFKSDDSSVVITGSGIDSYDVDFSVSTSVTDEQIDDRVAALLQEGTNITLTYNDVANTLTIGCDVDDEYIDDRVAALFQGGVNITLTYNDGANTFTIDCDVTDEYIDDRVNNLLVAGTNITLDYNDVANTLTINATTGGGGDVSYSGAPSDDLVTFFGTLTDTEITTVFTATTALQIRSIRFYVDDVTTQDVRLWINHGGGTYPFLTANLSQDEDLEINFTMMQLQNTDTIWLKVTNGGVNYVISYVERDEGFLVSGNLGDSTLTQVYNCPTNTEANIKSIYLLNGSFADTQHVTVYLDDTKIKRTLSLSPGRSIIVDMSELLRLTVSEKIKLKAETGNVQYMMEVLENAV